MWAILFRTLCMLLSNLRLISRDFQVTVPRDVQVTVANNFQPNVPQDVQVTVLKGVKSLSSRLFRSLSQTTFSLTSPRTYMSVSLRVFRSLSQTAFSLMSPRTYKSLSSRVFRSLSQTTFSLMSPRTYMSLFPGTFRWLSQTTFSQWTQESWDGLVVRAPDSWLKGRGFKSLQERRDNLFSRVSFLSWLLFWYPFHPRIHAVARKRSRPLSQRTLWSLSSKDVQLTVPRDVGHSKDVHVNVLKNPLVSVPSDVQLTVRRKTGYSWVVWL